MCGIVAMSGEVDRVWLEEGLHVVAPRGLDDRGVFVDERARVGLGHRQLAIIDLSPAGHQPMWDAKEQAVIVFNGELYNYRELRRELLTRGYPFQSRSDTVEEFAKRIGNGMRIVLEYVDALPMTERGNLRFVISDLPGGLISAP